MDPGVKQDPSLIEQVTFVQITTVAIENTCEPVSIDETAWGEGNPFGGGSWAMYFDYCIR